MSGFGVYKIKFNRRRVPLTLNGNFKGERSTFSIREFLGNYILYNGLLYKYSLLVIILSEMINLIFIFLKIECVFRFN